MLEVINANVGLVAALFISGAALGAIVARFTLPGPRRVRQLEEELEKAHKEHETYRAGVTTHFKKTAELVGEMTQSYKAVYDHLAYGSQSLCGEYEALTSSVFGPPRVIHDPTVAVGETVVAAAAAETSATTSQAAPADSRADATAQQPTSASDDAVSPLTDAAGADTTERTFSMSEAVSEIREEEDASGEAGSEVRESADADGDADETVAATVATGSNGPDAEPKNERESAGRA